MSTLTAFQPRPYVFTRATTKVELVQALPEDLQVYDPLWEKDVLRLGLIYWIKSSITGQMEGTPYVITENTDLNHLKEMLDFKMIWISKSPFE